MAGDAQPAALLLLSPWVDLSCSFDTYDLMLGVDRTATRERLLDMARLYVGENGDPRHPKVSPCFADLSGLAPMLIQVGGSEAMMGDAIALYGQARRHSVHAALEVWPEMVHVWHQYTDILEDARRALARPQNRRARVTDSTPMQWPDDAKLALSVVVNVEEGAEGNIRDGDKGMEPVDELGVFVKGPLRNFGNESNYQYGIKAGFRRVAKLLDKYDIKATWTACAMAIERAPQIGDYIRERGHEACSHGYRWQAQHRMDEEKERDYIRKAVTSLEKTTGTRPYGWLSRYLHTEDTRRLLAEEGFTYHMDDFSDDVPFWDRTGDKPIVVMPYAVDSNDMKFWTDPALTPDQWVKYAVDTFDWLYAEGVAGDPKIMSLGLHLRIIGRPGRIAAFEAFLKHVRTHKDVWVATRLEMAQAFAQLHPASG